MMPAHRIIKRYQNRKLYDTTVSCYTALDNIAELIQQGVEVKILDNRTQADITSTILLQLIYEKQKRSCSQISATHLHWIIGCEDWFFKK
jgi:polyhydroxyalkanoate synthesis repressor PhaR